MLEAVKRQLKLTYDHAILSYVMSILGFLVAMILWGVMRSVLSQTRSTVYSIGNDHGIGIMLTLHSVYADFSD